MLFRSLTQASAPELGYSQVDLSKGYVHRAKEDEPWAIRGLIHPALGEPSFAEFHGSDEMLNFVDSWCGGLGPEELTLSGMLLWCNPRRSEHKLGWHRDVTWWGDGPREAIRRCLEENRYCRDGLALLRRHDPQSMVLGWLEQDPQQDSAWTCHEPPDGWLRQPMLLLGGWWDPHLRGILDLHQRSLAAGGQPDLHIGPATHLNWWPEAQQLQLSFFKRHLCPDAPPSAGHAPQSKTSSVKLWDQRLETWSNVAPDRSSGGRWSLSGSSLACFDPEDGKLSPISLPPSPEDSSGEVVIVHDP